jgi:hypothetical protein
MICLLSAFTRIQERENGVCSLPRVAKRLLQSRVSHNIAHEYQARAVLTSAGSSMAQHLELVADGDVLEGQRFASAKRSSDQA